MPVAESGVDVLASRIPAGRCAASLVPTYAPGLPILMATAALVAGVCGPYLLSPLCAALLVWATYLDRVAVLRTRRRPVAAVGVAVSPAVVFMMIQPMSDVPNATFWTLSMLFAGRSPRVAMQSSPG